jgi:DNA polymerase I-like protein with 3'-5' exonuclease and polymerase domains
VAALSAYTVVDIETTGKNPLKDELLCVGIGDRVYPADEGRAMARRLMVRPGTVLVAHTNFDLRWLMLEGAKLGKNVHYHDTKVMAWLLDGTQQLDLDSLTERYCGYTPDKRLRQVAKRVMFRRDCSWCDSEGCSVCTDPRSLVPIEDAAWDELSAYNRSDLKAEGDLYEALRAELQKRGMWSHFLKEEAPFSRLLVEMETAGMPFDRDAAVEMLAEKEAEMETRAKWLTDFTSAPDFNLRSGDQVAHFLYTEVWEQDVRFPIPRILGMSKEDKRAAVERIAPPRVRVTKVGRDYAYGRVLLDGMGLAPPKRDRKQKTSRPSVSGKKLAVLYGENPWVIEYVAWKKLDKLAGYLRDWIERAHEGKLYARFDQSGTATGRLAGREPNLQQVAKESGVRDLFRGDLVIGDYAGLEVRISAHFSHDPVMMEIFASGGDLYGTLAAEAWGGEPTKENPNRPLMKVVMLGSQYGAAGETLAFVMSLAGIPTTPAKADGFLRDLKKTLPRMFEWRQEVMAQAEKDGYVETLAGRRRQLTGIKSADWQKKGTAERQAVSTKVQGSAADIVRRAMLAARGAVTPDVARICLQVHDEILWVRGPEWDAAAFPKLVEICQFGHGFELDVPLIFEAKIAQSWGEKGDSPGQIHSGAYEHLNAGGIQ